MNPNGNTTTYSALYSRFNNYWLRDSTDTTWTPGEKADVLQSAINDPAVTIIDYDSSTTTVAQQAQYSVPSKFYKVTNILIDSAGDGYWVPIDASAYSVINGKIIFNRFYKQMPGGKTLVIYGSRPLTTSDNIPVAYEEYILHIAAAEAFELLKTTLTSRFLKNDMTMAEIINSESTHRQRAAGLRKALNNQYAVEM